MPVVRSANDKTSRGGKQCGHPLTLADSGPRADIEQGNLNLPKRSLPSEGCLEMDRREFEELAAGARLPFPSAECVGDSA